MLHWEVNVRELVSVNKPLSNSIQCQCGSLLMIYLKLQKVQEILMVSYVKKILCKCSNAFLVDMFSCYVCSLSFQSFVILKDKFDFYLSCLMGKPTICIGENKGADQLRGNREADQRPCFRYSDSTIPLLLKSEISSF